VTKVDIDQVTSDNAWAAIWWIKGYKDANKRSRIDDRHTDALEWILALWEEERRKKGDS
jgi:hypothetical protein